MEKLAAFGDMVTVWPSSITAGWLASSQVVYDTTWPTPPLSVMWWVSFFTSRIAHNHVIIRCAITRGSRGPPITFSAHFDEPPTPLEWGIRAWYCNHEAKCYLKKQRSRTKNSIVSAPFRLVPSTNVGHYIAVWCYTAPVYCHVQNVLLIDHFSVLEFHTSNNEKDTDKHVRSYCTHSSLYFSFCFCEILAQ